MLTAFSTFLNSLTKVIMQTAGELDFGTIFEEGPLLYTHMAIFLFITFVVIMPILFNNLLVCVLYYLIVSVVQKAAIKKNYYYICV